MLYHIVLCCVSLLCCVVLCCVVCRIRRHTVCGLLPHGHIGSIPHAQRELVPAVVRHVQGAGGQLCARFLRHHLAVILGA